MHIWSSTLYYWKGGGSGGTSSSGRCWGSLIKGGENFVIQVVMDSCWFGGPLSHIVRKVVGCVEEVERWALSPFSCPQL
jgi:hypothetical protein